MGEVVFASSGRTVSGQGAPGRLLTCVSTIQRITGHTQQSACAGSCAWLCDPRAAWHPRQREFSERTPSGYIIGPPCQKSRGDRWPRVP